MTKRCKSREEKNLLPFHIIKARRDGCPIIPQKGRPRVEIKMNVQNGDIPELKNPTYKRIPEFVMDKHGVHVHSRCIAEVKRFKKRDQGVENIRVFVVHIWGIKLLKIKS